MWVWKDYFMKYKFKENGITKRRHKIIKLVIAQ